MIDISFYENNQTVKLPESWDEMTPEQICFVFREFDRCFKKKRSPLEFNIRVLYHFLGVRRSFLQQLRISRNPFSQLKIGENVFTLCQNHLAFLFTKEDNVVRLSFDSVLNPMPEVRCKLGPRLIGPASLVENLTFAEFRHASASLNAFFKSGDINNLDECIAHLYRKKCRKPNKAGRPVKPVSNESFAKDLARVRRLEPWKKNMIMMWFSNCINFLQTGEVEIDGETVDLKSLFSGDENSSGPKFNWNDLLVQIARDNTIGNIDAVDEEPLFSILSIMWTNHKENKKYAAIQETTIHQ